MIKKLKKYSLLAFCAMIAGGYIISVQAPANHTESIVHLMASTDDSDDGDSNNNNNNNNGNNNNNNNNGTGGGIATGSDPGTDSVILPEDEVPL